MYKRWVGGVKLKGKKGQFLSFSPGTNETPRNSNRTSTTTKRQRSREGDGKGCRYSTRSRKSGEGRGIAIG